MSGNEGLRLVLSDSEGINSTQNLVFMRFFKRFFVTEFTLNEANVFLRMPSLGVFQQHVNA